MAIRRGLGERLPYQAHFFNGDVLYKRFTPAGPDHAQVAACAGIADYIDLLHARHFETETDVRTRARRVHDLMRGAETALLQRVLDYLRGRNDVRLIGPVDAAVKAPTVAVVANQSGAALAAELSRHGVMAGGGDFYAVRPLKALGVDPERGVLRLSFVHYTSPGDVDRLIRALDHVL